MNGVNNVNPNAGTSGTSEVESQPRRIAGTEEKEAFVRELATRADDVEKHLGPMGRHLSRQMDRDATNLLREIGVEKGSVADIAANSGMTTFAPEPEEEEGAADAGDLGGSNEAREAEMIFAEDTQLPEEPAARMDGQSQQNPDGSAVPQQHHRGEGPGSDDDTAENLTPGDVTLAGMGVTPMQGQGAVAETADAAPPSPADTDNLSDLMVNTVSKFMISSPVAGGGEARMQFDPDAGIPAKECAITQDANGLSVTFTVDSDDDKAALEAATGALLESLSAENPGVEVNVEVIVENPDTGGNAGGGSGGDAEQGSHNRQEYSGEQMSNE